MKKTFPFVILLSGVVLFFAGCGSVNKSYLHPLSEIQKIKKVAIMPVTSLTGAGPSCEEKVRNLFALNLLTNGSIDVLDFGELNKFLSGENIANSQNVDLAVLQKIGATFKAQGVVFIVVEDYNQSIPQISMSARMVDSQTGIITWMSHVSKTGTTNLPTFGIGETTSIDELTSWAINDMIKSMYK